MGSQADAVNALYPNLSAPQRRVLRTLADFDGKDDGWGTGRLSVSFFHGRTLRSLEQRGLLARQGHTVWITDKGREALDG